MTRVCHMSTVHRRYDARILKKECVSLSNAGYDVALLVADNKPDEVYDGVKISSIDFHPKNRLDRILNSKKKMLKKALEVNADIYHFHDPELIPLGLKLLRKGKKVIYDSHEDYPKDISSKSWIPQILRKLLGFLFEKYEMNAAKQFSAIISVTPHIVDRFLTINKNSYMITNYPIYSHLKHRTDLKKPQICFTGLVAAIWSQESIINTISEYDNLRYCIAGPADNEYLTKLKELNGWNQVDYLGLVSSDVATKIQSESIAGMAILVTSAATADTLGTLGNTKIFEYMMAGIPVICTNFILWRKIINTWNCGICVNPYDQLAIGRAIQYLIDNPDEARKMGLNGQDAVIKEYNWGTQEKTLLTIYDGLFIKEEDSCI